MSAKHDRTRQQQLATVLKLANQLRFELLLLNRQQQPAIEAWADGRREPTLTEIYAAAVLRAAGRGLTP